MIVMANSLEAMSEYQDLRPYDRKKKVVLILFIISLYMKRSIVLVIFEQYIFEIAKTQEMKLF